MTDRKFKHLQHTLDDYERVVARNLNEEFERKLTFGDRVADRIAAFGGSWRFIIIFAALLAVWIVWNSLPALPQFDPYPFILLNLVLSFLAGFQAPIIMMSQNRQEVRNHVEAELDAAINYAAAQRIEQLQSHTARVEAELAEVKRLLQSLVATGPPPSGRNLSQSKELDLEGVGGSDPSP